MGAPAALSNFVFSNLVANSKSVFAAWHVRTKKSQSWLFYTTFYLCEKNTHKRLAQKYVMNDFGCKGSLSDNTTRIKMFRRGVPHHCFKSKRGLGTLTAQYYWHKKIRDSTNIPSCGLHYLLQNTEHFSFITKVPPPKGTSKQRGRRTYRLNHTTPLIGHDNQSLLCTRIAT